MTGEEIRNLLKEKGATMTAVAEAADVSVTTVSRVIYSQDKSRRIASVISLFLGKRIDDLWPGQYPANYTRRSSSDRIKNELKAAAKSVDQARAA